MSNIIVVYYSAQDHTRSIARQIASNLGADFYELRPTQKYTEEDLDWADATSRVNLEHQGELSQDIELDRAVPLEWNKYDTVIVGYPIWWGDAAWPINGFVKAADFTGKKVYTFCTSYSSPEGGSAADLRSLANGGEWQEPKRFFQDTKTSDVAEWTNKIKQEL